MSVFGTLQAQGANVFPNPPVSSPTFATGVGDLIIGWVGTVNGAPGALSLSDTAGNSFTALTKRGTDGSSTGRFFYCLAATHASATNALTASTANNSVICYVYSWNIALVGGTAAYDFDTDFSALASSPSTSPSFTATGTDEFIVAVVCDVARGDSFTAGAGFTLDSDTGGSFPGGQRSEHQLTASPGSTAGFSWSSGSTCQIMAMGFKGSPTAVQQFPTVVIMT